MPSRGRILATLLLALLWSPIGSKTTETPGLSTAKASSVVTVSGNPNPPDGFLEVGFVRVDFDASSPAHGLPRGVNLVEGDVISTLTYSTPEHVDYAQDSPVSDLFTVAMPHHLTLNFDPAKLGRLPSTVGLVFTDLGQASGGTITLEAWSGPNRSGTLLGSVWAFRGNDETFQRNFGDDCFFGIKDAGPIRSVHMTSNAESGGLEADVLYFSLQH